LGIESEPRKMGEEEERAKPLPRRLISPIVADCLLVCFGFITIIALIDPKSAWLYRVLIIASASDTLSGVYYL